MVWRSGRRKERVSDRKMDGRGRYEGEEGDEEGRDGEEGK